MIDRQMRGIVPSSASYARFNRSIDEGKNELGNEALIPQQGNRKRQSRKLKIPQVGPCSQ
jgi:hypothetical protein